MTRHAIDLVGMRYGRLVVIERSTSRVDRVRWRCLCDCGSIADIRSDHLRSGHAQSCGCFALEQTRAANTRHGKSRTKEFIAYYEMKIRCLNPDGHAWKHYGGRGISVCDRWLHGDGQHTGIECFFADMGEAPSAKHSLERRNVNGNYEPSNCYWATWEQQSNNKRNTILIPINGEMVPLSIAAKRYGFNRATLYDRIVRNAMPVAEALAKPVTSNG